MKFDAKEIIANGGLTASEKKEFERELDNNIKGIFIDVPIYRVFKETKHAIRFRVIELVMNRLVDYDDSTYDKIIKLLCDEFENYCINRYIDLTMDCIKKIKERQSQQKMKGRKLTYSHA